MDDVQLKFCGLTRPDDVAYAESLGAAYVGAVFAGGPREQTADGAKILFAGVQQARRVGVVRADTLGDVLAALAARVPLDVLQLHADPDPALLERLLIARGDTNGGWRAAAGGLPVELWAVLRIAGDVLPPQAPALFRLADAIVLDTRSASGLGGTGATFQWNAVAERIAPYRGRTRVIVAGGLTPHNIAHAIRALRPAGVDVSSGVEVAPGVKDRHLMRQFADAARAAGGR
jgi:phosphoribosylanthranilate isomerase